MNSTRPLFPGATAKAMATRGRKGTEG